MKITLDIPDGIIAGFFTFFKLACFEKLFFVF